MLAIKTLGNIGASGETVSVLTKCFLSRDLKIRLEAIKAFHRIPCSVDVSILFENNKCHWFSVYVFGLFSSKLILKGKLPSTVSVHIFR